MAIQKGGKLPDEDVIGFDTDADYIPFDLSPDNEDEVDNSRPRSRGSVEIIESIPGSELETAKRRNGNGHKRKRNVIESSPEPGPPPQRQKVARGKVNPWQTDINQYASLRETARMSATAVTMYTDSQTT
jgi:hypothetical protein